MEGQAHSAQVRSGPVRPPHHPVQTIHPSPLVSNLAPTCPTVPSPREVHNPSREKSFREPRAGGTRMPASASVGSVAPAEGVEGEEEVALLVREPIVRNVIQLLRRLGVLGEPEPLVLVPEDLLALVPSHHRDESDLSPLGRITPLSLSKSSPISCWCLRSSPARKHRGIPQKQHADSSKMLRLLRSSILAFSMRFRIGSMSAMFSHWGSSSPSPFWTLWVVEEREAGGNEKGRRVSGAL